MKVVDMHCDTIAALAERGQEGWSLLKNGFHVNLEGMEKGDYLLQNFALFVALQEGKDPWAKVNELADCFEKQMRDFGDRIAWARSFSDIEKAEKEGKMCALLTVEEGAVCRGSLEKLRLLFERGVRMLTLTWNYPNELGYPNVAVPETGKGKPDFRRPQTEKGLTQKGIEFVKEMQRMGMIVDVSHLSDAGFYDVLAHTDRPFVASHSNARAVCPNVRNLTDDMIRRLAERGGVTGLNFCPSFLEEGAEENEKPVLDAVVRHAKHIADVGGIECLGLGSDFDGIPTPKGLEGAGKMPLLDDAFKKAGFPASQREKILSGNVLRLYRDTLPQ